MNTVVGDIEGLLRTVVEELKPEDRSGAYSARGCFGGTRPDAGICGGGQVRAFHQTIQRTPRYARPTCNPPRV